MIDPIRELLDAGIQSDRGGGDDRWKFALRNQILNVQVEVHSILFEKTLPLHDILKMHVGDVMPIDLPSKVYLSIEDVPIFSGQVGVSKSNYALKVEEIIFPERLENEPASGIDVLKQLTGTEIES
jgi:flagellar motor switch protein FliM